MKEHKFYEYICWGITAVLVIVTCILVGLAFIRWQSVQAAIQKLNTILAPVIYGAILAYLMNPIYNRLRKWAKIATDTFMTDKKFQNSFCKAVATVGSLILLSAVVVGLFSMIIPQVWESIVGIVYQIPGYTVKIGQWLEATFANNPSVEEMVMNFYTQGVDQLNSWTQSATALIPNIEKVVTGVYTGIMNVFNLFKNILIGVIIMMYLLNIKELLCAQSKKIVYGLFPLSVANEVVEKFRYIHMVFSGFIIGKIVDSIIIGVLTFVCLNFMKMPYTLLISVIVGVTNVIPFFGPFIGAIPSAFLILMVSPMKCLWFLVAILAIQQFDGNILGPKILGNSTGVSSFWVLFSILFFGGIMGPVGTIIGVPTFAVISKLVTEFIEKRLKKKNLSVETADYDKLDHIDVEKKTYIK